MARRVIAAAIGTALLFGQAQPVFAAFGDGTPTVFNPGLFGAQLSEGRIQGSTGAFTQRVPLDIPPGRSGLPPDVSLDYNSQRAKDSMVGYGWALSVPYIERINKTGSQDIYGNTPYFSSSVDGELALATSSAASSSPTIMDSLDLPYSIPESVAREHFGLTLHAELYTTAPFSAESLRDILDLADNGELVCSADRAKSIEGKRFRIRRTGYTFPVFSDDYKSAALVVSHSLRVKGLSTMVIGYVAIYKKTESVWRRVTTIELFAS